MKIRTNFATLDTRHSTLGTRHSTLGTRHSALDTREMLKYLQPRHGTAWELLSGTNSYLGGLVDGPVTRDGHPLSGVTRPIRSRYVPALPEPKRKRGGSSLKIGERVHRQLFHRISCKKGKCRCPSGTRPGRMHRFAKQALALLEKARLTPVGAEVPVAFRNLGTRLDIVALGPSGRSTCISVKTGYRSDVDLGLKLRGRFSDKPYHGRNLDAIQAAAERAILRRGHGVRVDDYLILELPEGVLKKAPDWTANEALQDGLLRDLTSN